MIRRIELSRESFIDIVISNNCDVLCVKLEGGGPVLYINDGGTGQQVLNIKTCQTEDDAPRGSFYIGTLLFFKETSAVHYFYRIGQ